MIQMVPIKQMVPSSKRRRNVFKSCWNEPRVKPIPLYKKASSPWKVFWIPHTRERLAASVYLIITIKKITACARAAESCSVLRAAVGCALWAERERSSREHGWCAGPSGQQSRKSHIWPRYQEGRRWYPLAAGQFHTEVTVWGDKGRSSVCPGREGFVLPGLPWLSLAAFAPGLILEAARSLGILEQICN